MDPDDHHSGVRTVGGIAHELADLAPTRSDGDLATRLYDDPDELHEIVEDLLSEEQPGARALLVIDELEELFTLGDREQAARLVALRPPRAVAWMAGRSWS